MAELETERLMLRQWRDQDFPAFQQLNSDPQVMEYFPSTLNTQQSNAMAVRCRDLIATRGWGFWAAELKKSGEFIGFVGLHTPKSSLPFSPCIEIGWRLLRKHWGNGYTTEAGKASLRFAFEALQVDEVMSFTPVSNFRSAAVMKRLGMRDTKQNFRHPDLPEHHPLSEHVLYKLTRSDWQANNA